MVGNIRRCRKHVRAIDLSPPCLGPGAPDLLYPSPRGCRLHSGLQTSASPPREEHQPPRVVGTAKSASERARVDERPGERGTPKGVRPSGVDTLLGISTYDCPGGVHRSAKQSSPGLDPSRALRALFSTSRKRVTYRDTRESTEGLDISWRSAAVVAAWFPARFTAQERTTYGILVEDRWLSLLLLLSLSLPLSCSLLYICVYSVYPADPQRSSPLTGEADQPASRIYGARNSDDGRSSSHVTSGNSVNFLSLSFCSDSGTSIFFFEQARNDTGRNSPRGGRFGKTHVCEKRAGLVLFCGSTPPT